MEDKIIDYLRKNGPQKLVDLAAHFKIDKKEIIIHLLDGGASCTYNKKIYDYEWHMEI